jgi:hypothetical protein
MPAPFIPRYLSIHGAARVPCDTSRRMGLEALRLSGFVLRYRSTNGEASQNFVGSVLTASALPAGAPLIQAHQARHHHDKVHLPHQGFRHGQ